MHFGLSSRSELVSARQVHAAAVRHAAHRRAEAMATEVAKGAETTSGKVTRPNPSLSGSCYLVVLRELLHVQELSLVPRHEPTGSTAPWCKVCMSTSRVYTSSHVMVCAGWSNSPGSCYACDEAACDTQEAPSLFTPPHHALLPKCGLQCVPSVDRPYICRLGL
jgi:hypothetical protein